MFRRKSDPAPSRPDEGAPSVPGGGAPAGQGADDPSCWVASPCTGICVLQAGVCTGCGRTLDEIARWTGMDEAQRRTALRAAEARRAAAS